jgi:hypothetical protein
MRWIKARLITDNLPCRNFREPVGKKKITLA